MKTHRTADTSRYTLRMRRLQVWWGRTEKRPGSLFPLKSTSPSTTAPPSGIPLILSFEYLVLRSVVHFHVTLLVLLGRHRCVPQNTYALALIKLREDLLLDKDKPPSHLEPSILFCSTTQALPPSLALLLALMKASRTGSFLSRTEHSIQIYFI